MADGIPIPGRRHRRGVRGIHAHMAQFMALAVDHQDVVRPLEDLQQEVPKNVGHPTGPTLVARSRIPSAGQRNVAVLLHDCGCLGLQNRVGVIADQLVEVGHAVGAARPVRHRAGTRCRGFEAGEVGVRPYAGEIRDRCGALRRAAGRPDRGRHVLARGGGRRRRGRQCRHYKEIPLPRIHAPLPFTCAHPDVAADSWPNHGRPPRRPVAAEHPPRRPLARRGCL
jgi:hypothetical protein